MPCVWSKIPSKAQRMNEWICFWFSIVVVVFFLLVKLPIIRLKSYLAIITLTNGLLHMPSHSIHVKSRFSPGGTTCFQLRICGMNHPPIDRWWFSIRNVPWLPLTSLSCLVDTLLEKCIDGIATLVCYHSTTRYHQTFYTYLWFEVVVVILLEQCLLFLLFPSLFL